MRLLQVLIVLLCLLGHGLAVTAQSIPDKKFHGFLGTYHPYKGTAYGGGGWAEGDLLQHAFSFGENAIISRASYNQYTFAENADNSCREWDVNKIYGILLPPREKGVINQPKDTDLLKPFQVEPGMIQGAKRFSELSKRCPQISGAIIDDLFNDYPKQLSVEDLREIKGALLGRTVDENGRVDHSSPATTPHLKLYIVMYEHELERPFDKAVLNLIDGVNFWTWRQTEHHKNFDSYIETVRHRFPGKEIIAGVYVFNGRETPTPTSVHHIIERAIDLYSLGKVNGLLIFSAVWMSREKSSRERWNELDLPQLLGRVYYPHLGDATGRVVDAKTKEPIAKAIVTVNRIVGGKRLLVARKFTDERGAYRFGGWVGKGTNERASYEIKIENALFKPKVIKVKLRAGESIKFAEAKLGK